VTVIVLSNLNSLCKHVLQNMRDCWILLNLPGVLEVPCMCSVSICWTVAISKTICAFSRLNIGMWWNMISISWHTSTANFAVNSCATSNCMFVLFRIMLRRLLLKQSHLCLYPLVWKPLGSSFLVDGACMALNPPYLLLLLQLDPPVTTYICMT
jgi:hypothetical protein